MDEKDIARLFKLDLSKGTERFRDALLARCLAVLNPDFHIVELDDSELDLLAAAGDPFSDDAPASSGNTVS